MAQPSTPTLISFINPSPPTYLASVSNLNYFFPDIQKNRNSPLVCWTLLGCKRLYGSSIIQKWALTLDDLQHMVSHYEKSTLHDDHLFLSMLLTRFFILLRLTELTDLETVLLRDPRKQIWHLSVTISHDNYSFFLPGHKSNKFSEGNIIIMLHSTNFHNAYCYFTSYLNLHDSKFPAASSLWLWNDRTVPTRMWFIWCLWIFFDKTVDSQSMWAGGATLLAETGTLPHLIQALGQWKMDTFEIYILKAEVQEIGMEWKSWTLDTKVVRPQDEKYTNILCNYI